jgi:hypothetical protein
MKKLYTMLRPFLFIYSVVAIFVLQAQQMEFSISSGGKVIGEATMVKTMIRVTPPEFKIVFTSEYTPSINKEILLKDRTECHFRNDTLLVATVENIVNTRVRAVIEQRLENGRYKRKVNNKEEFCIQPIASWSFIRFFLEKPDQSTQFMSEMFGKMFQAYKAGNTFSYTDHFGRKGKFVYDIKGNFVKASIQTSMEDLEFSLKK